MLVTTYKLTRCYSPGDHSVTFRPLKASNLIPLFCVCGCVLATTNITPHEPPAGLRSSSTDIHYCNIAFSVFSCILDDVINEGGCEAPPARPPAKTVICPASRRQVAHVFMIGPRSDWPLLLLYQLHIFASET